MKIGVPSIGSAIRHLGIEGKPVCFHSSLRSFGWVDGGAPAVVHAFLSEACTLLVPTFTGWYETLPPPGRWIERNGISRDRPAQPWWVHEPFRPDSPDCAQEMGAIPRAVALMPGRARGRHPLSSFCAIGPDARELVARQTPMDVYAPLEELIARDGWVVLAGVGLDRMTLIHQAEHRAGRELFRRWAVGPDGGTVECAVGSCSRGFERLRPAIEHLARTASVGEAVWEAFPGGAVTDALAEAIKRDPAITSCGRAECERCPDAIAGGPLV